MYNNHLISLFKCNPQSTTNFYITIKNYFQEFVSFLDADLKFVYSDTILCRYLIEIAIIDIHETQGRRRLTQLFRPLQFGEKLTNTEFCVQIWKVPA